MDLFEKSIPFPEVPLDTLRKGLPTRAEQHIVKHPVQILQEKDTRNEEYRSLRNVYGMALPARMDIERQILQKRARLPPLPSSNFGYDAYFGRMSQFDCESYLGLEEFSEKMPGDIHSLSETLYGIGAPSEIQKKM